MKYKRIRIKIRKYLEENGPKSTHQIYEYINGSEKNGIQMQALANVLAKSPYIRESHTERVKGITLNSYQGKVWTVK